MDEKDYELDSLLISRAMMYRRQRKRANSKPTTPTDVTFQGKTFGPRSLSLRTETLGEYVGRGLTHSHRTTPTAPTSPGWQEEGGVVHVPETSLVSETSASAGIPPGSNITDEAVLDAITQRLEQLGDETDNLFQDGLEKICPGLSSAFSEGVKGVSYTLWKSAFISAVKAPVSWSGIGSLFKFTDTFLTYAETTMGGVSLPDLEEAIEDHNKKLMLEVFGTFLKNAKGFKAILTSEQNPPDKS